MRKIRVNTFISLDGIMQAPGNPTEDTSGGFIYGGWSVNYWDSVMMDFMKEFSKTETELLLGRKTYDIFVSHWPHVKNDPAADQINEAKKYVVSESLTHSDWKNTIILNDNPLQKIQRLKEE